MDSQPIVPEIPFTKFQIPAGGSAWIPADVELKVPEKTSLDPGFLHYLIYIPWHDSYLEAVDPGYLDFFKIVLPYLHVRTTDVHIVTCLPYIKDLVRTEEKPVDERAVQIAFMLHDSGWSQMTELEIAQSLGVQGLSLSGEAVNPKARHALLGQQVAQKLIEEYPFRPALMEAQKDLIYQAILFHDKPWELAAGGKIPATIKTVCNVDHLWSFTHRNFWQDTVRKGVNPDEYLNNLEQELEGYFVSAAGKLKARQLLEARRVEVKAWADWTRMDR